MNSSSDDPSSIPPSIRRLSTPRRFRPQFEDHDTWTSLHGRDIACAFACAPVTLKLMRWVLLPGLLAICVLLGLDRAPVQAVPLPAIQYVSFQGETLSLYP
jgi:hypothetical protein